MRNQSTAEQSAPAVHQDIVAAVLSHQGDLALLRRSPLVTGDVGRWNCVTGYLDAYTDPLAQAVQEIREEAGIAQSDLRLLSSKVLHLEGLDGRIWRVHTFHFACQTRALTLNWENDDCAWMNPAKLNELAIVPWFADILEACNLDHSIEVGCV